MTYKVLILGDAGTGKTSLRTQYLYRTFSFQYKSTIGANFVTKEVTLEKTPPIQVRRGAEHSIDSVAGSLTQSFHSVQAFWPNESRASRVAISESPSMSSLRPEKVSLCLWDTAGQERFNALAPTFYRGADAAVLVYDIMDPHSLRSLAAHHAAFLQYSGTHNPVIMIVGNKLDTVPQTPRPVFGSFMNDSRVNSRDVEKLVEMLQDQSRSHAKKLNSYSSNEYITEFAEVSAKLGTGVDSLFFRVAELCHQRSKTVQVESFDVDETINIGHTRRNHCCH